MRCALFLFVAASAAAGEGWVWDLPKGFPVPRVPADNPMSAAKVELGRYLFYDARMSVNGKQSCASCHKQELAFTDGRATGLGTTGEAHSRSAMSLVNIAYGATLTWANPGMKTLEEQALTPMFGEHPVELGLREGDGFVPMLRRDAKYREQFARAFPEDGDPFTIANVTKAIACFERSIISGRSPYDRYHYGGDDHAVSEAAKRGEILFFDQHHSCFRCHGGFNFSSAAFHNNGLYHSYPANNPGMYEHTKVEADVGKFKAPTLRNIAVTGPYMHDGSLRTLEEVLEHYATGGRKNPNQDHLVHGFEMSAQERSDLIAFLNALTDDAVLHDARFASPW
jgi:cytochrome c peroxidase